MDSAPSMVSRAGDTLIVRRVVSGEQLVLDQDGSVLENYIKNNTHLNNLNNLNNLSSLSNLHHRGDQLSLPAAAALAALTFPALQQQQNQFLRNQQLTVKNLSKSSDSAINYANSNGTKSEDGDSLPQCKIKRNYSCNNCSFFTQNPRKFLTHLRDLHGEKIVINECKFCLYASRHYQKLVRHMKMVHGSTEVRFLQK